MAQRSHEPAHGLAKEPIIIDDRYQYLFHHAACGHSPDPSCGLPSLPTLRMELLDVYENATSAMPMPRKLWLSSRGPPVRNGPVQVQRLGLDMRGRTKTF